MNGSFYTGALGAMAQQSKMDVIANNFANVNTAGYKSKSAVFQDLIHYNMHDPEGTDSRLRSGSGVRLEQTNTDYTNAGYQTTGGEYDFAITGDGFFMLSDPVTNELSYSREGHFRLSLQNEEYYLVNTEGKRVLDKEQQPIMVEMADPTEEEEEEDYEDDEDAEREPTIKERIGVYNFAVKDGLQNIGDNQFVPTAKNGEPILVESAMLMEKSLEMSGVDTATEISRLIEAQRAYSYALRMVQTSDEIEATINSLRA